MTNNYAIRDIRKQLEQLAYEAVETHGADKWMGALICVSAITAAWLKPDGLSVQESADKFCEGVRKLVEIFEQSESEHQNGL